MQHVFVDFENVQAIDLGSIGDAALKVTVLLGKSQKRLEVGLVQAMLKRPAGFRLIEMDFSGKNALDLALAWHLGQAAAGDPTGTFHIISRDKDFDPLVAHLRRGNIKAFRHDRFSLPSILGGRTAAGRPEAKPGGRPEAKPAGAVDWVAVMEGRLRRNITNRPKRKRTLLAHMQSHFANKLTGPELNRIVDALVRRGTIAIDEKDKVTYPFTDG
jgi:hypothetical protein